MSNNAGSFIYTLENGASTMYTLPNAIVSELDDKLYIEHTVTSRSFYLRLHSPYIARERPYIVGAENNPIIKNYMDILNDGLYAQFESGDAAIIYELIVRDILDFTYTYANGRGIKSRCHYFEDTSGEVYDIKVIHDVIDFVILISDITPDKDK